MELFILDSDLNIVDLIDEYKSCLWCSRYYEAGEFELVVLPDKFEYLQIGNYVMRRDDETVMIIEKRQVTSDIEDGNLLTVSGRSLESILSRRIVWNTITYKGELSGFFEKTLNENIIKPTDNDRKISNFAISDDSITTDITISKQTSYENIYDLFVEICKGNGLGFKILLDLESKTFYFCLYEGINHSYMQDVNPYITFSKKFDNLATSDFSENKESFYNVALVGGEGEGSDRKKETVSVDGKTKTGLNRYEVFVDAKSLSTTNSEEITDAEYLEQLKQAGAETLAENTMIQDFDAEIITGIKNYEYGVDFNIGDIVQIVSEYGGSYSARITEIDYNEDSAGYNLAPTFEIIE